MPLPIDLDAETIELDGQWFTRDDLARKLRSMLDAGDFAVSKPSAALEQLTQTLATVKPVTVKLTTEMIESLQQLATKHEKTVGALVREAVAAALGSPSAVKVPPPPPAAFVAGPGAVRAAGMEIETVEPDEVAPLPLTTPAPKKKDEEPAERRWFGG